MPWPSETKGWRAAWIIDTRYEAGGDPVVEAVSDDGDATRIRAGQGLTFSVGGEFRPRWAPEFAVRGLVGYKFASISEPNVDVVVSRVPISLTLERSLARDWRLGAGIVHHTRIRPIGLGPATGGTVELGWRWLALTYTVMEYRGDFDNDFDANAIGIALRWVLGER